MAIIYNNIEDSSSRDGIATNSLVIANGDFVQKSAGFVIKAGITGEIIGLAMNDKTYTATNQTVNKDIVNYVKNNSELLVRVVASAALTQANEGSYFNITIAGLADVATISTSRSVVNTSDVGSLTDPVITHQLKLEKFIDQNNSIFSIVL